LVEWSSANTALIESINLRMPLVEIESYRDFPGFAANLHR